MKALIIATFVLAACAPVASAPSQTPTATGATLAPTPSPTPTAAPSPTATAEAGLTRYTNTELGYVIDLPAGWRRAVCSAGVITASPLAASEIFVGVPEVEEYIAGGARMVLVQVVADRGLTALDWLRGNASQPDVRVEPVTLGGRTGARAFIGGSGDTYSLAFAARGWIYAIERAYFGSPDQELERVLTTLRLLDDATLGRVAATTPAPRTIESVADAIADGFARKDIGVIADTMAACITSGAVPGDAMMVSRTAYLTGLAIEFATGTSVRVEARPIDNDANLGRYVRSTFSKPGQPDQRVDLILRAQGSRWSLGAVLVRGSGN